MSDDDGVWRTIGGRRVFIKNGQSLPNAMKASGKFDKEIKQNKERIEKLSFYDVLDEYFQNGEDNIGKVILNERYIVKNHDEEIENAHWLVKKFGYDLELLPETNKNGIKTPDYKWKGHFWEYKKVSSKNSIDKQTQSALHQIKSNAGGIILDVSNSILSQEEILIIVKKRLQYSAKTNLDIIIKKDKEILSIYRYKKI